MNHPDTFRRAAQSRLDALKAGMRRRGLSLVLLLLFLLTLAGQAAAGLRDYNRILVRHGQAPVGLYEYSTSGHFIAAVSENWQAEFLHKLALILLTCYLFQKGSPVSKDPAKPEPVDEDPLHHRGDPLAPWPVRAGGRAAWLYSHSLTAAFLLLFAASLLLHAWGGHHAYNAEQLRSGDEAVSLISYLATARFWFESLQNWQSEFLSLLTLVVLTIFFRQKHSAGSKPVHAPHASNR